MERPLNGKNIILKFNVKLQSIGDGAGLSSGLLRMLGVDYNKFSYLIVELNQFFYFDEDRSGRIKKIILQSMEKSWNDTRGRLYNNYYKPTRTLEKNLEERLVGIDKEYW
ncbi:hypothetical protein Ahy_B08g091134 [Arachis hypogaea]|uniref:Uncharacterized protein n=1 Tax=Arachis hypogaea TaxID=3818 RepID=A0A444Y1L1_ARAHY|nr:hypothetical protein Ahy_B08g091134 [Arachis hypogaea]